MTLGRPATICLLTALLAGCHAPASGQTPADLAGIRSELAALREAQDAARKDIEAIRTLLEQALGPRAAGPGQAPAANVAPLNIAGRPARGPATAAVTVVEYSDYACPYCGQYATQTYPQIVRDYIQTNKIRYVFKNYPIAQLHPNAFRAHEAAACAGDQGHYWEMHDRIFADQRNLTLEGFVEHARALDLDATKLRNCIEGPAHDGLIQEDIDEAIRGGVRGTPVFALALTDPDGQVATPVRVLVGAQPYQAFKDAIDALLAQAAAQPAKGRQ